MREECECRHPQSNNTELELERLDECVGAARDLIQKALIKFHGEIGGAMAFNLLSARR